MKLQFPKQDPQKIVDAITSAMGGRALAEMVSFEVQPTGMLVKISKLGTSTLTFDRKEVGDKVQFLLSSEKIALTHKAFKDDVKSKLCKLVEQAGGQILES